ncbi:MAG: hypothetical protein JWN14_364 [Chthonomonadales bacterium]|nr:hypothetical protein [Chthonomonadales bacterium]
MHFSLFSSLLFSFLPAFLLCIGISFCISILDFLLVDRRIGISLYFRAGKF